MVQSEGVAETVPGMAAKVETRRRQLGLDLGKFATAAGLSREGLKPVVQGLRREYKEKTVLGVARALQWGPDWYERLAAGLDPVDDEAMAVAELRREVADLRDDVRAALELLRAIHQHPDTKPGGHAGDEASP